MRCITSPAPFQCGRSNARTSTPGNAASRAATDGLVRPVADADEQRALVEPERVAALGERRLLELGRRWARPAASSAGAIAAGSLRRPSFPGRRSTAPCCADEHRVVDVDRVGVPRVVVARRRPRRRRPRGARRAARARARRQRDRAPRASRTPASASPSSASGGRTRTRSSCPVMDALPKACTAQDATPTSGRTRTGDR